MPKKVDPREWPPDSFKLAFEALSQPGCMRLVALDGDEEVGFAAYRPSTEDGTELVSLASKYPGNKIGTQLIDHLREMYDLWVWVDRRAEKFYEKLGFEWLRDELEPIRGKQKKYQWTQ